MQPRTGRDVTGSGRRERRAAGDAAAGMVLVVDDTDATRIGLAELLRERGYAVIEARTGAEALRFLREHPDVGVVVLDLAMPGTDGYWFRTRQLQDPRLAAIPVVVFTGVPRAAVRTDLLTSADVLHKSLSVTPVLDAVGRHCPPRPRRIGA